MQRDGLTLMLRGKKKYLAQAAAFLAVVDHDAHAPALGAQHALLQREDLFSNYLLFQIARAAPRTWRFFGYTEASYEHTAVD